MIGNNKPHIRKPLGPTDGGSMPSCSDFDLVVDAWACSPESSLVIQLYLWLFLILYRFPRESGKRGNKILWSLGPDPDLTRGSPG